MTKVPDVNQSANHTEPPSEYTRRELIGVSGLSAAGLALESASGWGALINGTALHATADDSGPRPLDHLRKCFVVLPGSGRPSCYWWWFNDLMDRQSISVDLEEFKAKGMGGVMLVCTANGYGAGPMRSGPPFLSPQWRELYKHALREAAKPDMEVGVNFCGGWVMGGPWITPVNAGRWRRTLVGQDRHARFDGDGRPRLSFLAGFRKTKARAAPTAHPSTTSAASSW